MSRSGPTIVIQSKCPLHTPEAPRSPKLWDLLHSHGMDELLPAFANVGVKNDVQFEQFCWLSEKERVTLFQEQQKPNEFQLMMLRVAFRDMDQAKA